MRLSFILSGVVLLGAFQTSALFGAEESLGTIEKLGGLNKTPFVQIEFLMVEKAEWVGTIAASYRGGKMFSNTDKVYLDFKDKNVSIGDRFTVFKSLGSVKKPGDGFGKAGERIQILGSMRVTAVLPDLVEGVLYDFQEDAKVGDHVAPLMQTQIELRPQESASVVSGKVLGPAGPNHLSGSFEMAFLDKGEADGLRVNDRVEIIRKGEGADEEMKKRLPDVAVAELIIVHTSKKFSTAYVRSSVEQFEAGARFRTVKSNEIYLDDKKASNLQGQTPESRPTESNSGSLQN